MGGNSEVVRVSAPAVQFAPLKPGENGGQYRSHSGYKRKADNPFRVTHHGPFGFAAGLAFLFGAALIGAGPIFVFGLNHSLRVCLAISCALLIIASALAWEGAVRLLGS